MSKVKAVIFFKGPSVGISTLPTPLFSITGLELLDEKHRAVLSKMFKELNNFCQQNRLDVTVEVSEKIKIDFEKFDFPAHFLKAN